MSQCLRRDFILFHSKWYPLEMGEPQVVEVRTHLVVRANDLAGSICRLRTSERNKIARNPVSVYHSCPKR